MAAADGLPSSHSGNPRGGDMGPLVPHPELPPPANPEAFLLSATME